MAVIDMLTPKGPVKVTIAGDTPTDEEMNNIRNFAPPDDPSEGFDYRLIDLFLVEFSSKVLFILSLLTLTLNNYR